MTLARHDSAGTAFIIERVPKGRLILKSYSLNMRRFLLATAGALIALTVSFLVFNFAYIEWAVWKYPHHNSMAGFAAFIYGIPVALGAGVIAFVIVFLKSKRSGERAAPTATK
jgi:hypothetical protein